MPDRAKLLPEMLRRRVLVLDGAMGTAIQQRQLGPQDFGGADYEGCNEYLVITRPDVITAIHESYLRAGCDIIETDTFGGTPLVLNEYELGGRAYEINRAAAELARAAADRFASADQPRFVAGSLGPTTKAISVTGGVTFADLIGHFHEQARGLLDGGVDYLLLETCQDTRNIKAALLGIERLFAASGRRVPVAVSGTIEPMGTMLAGQSVDALLSSLNHVDLLYIGLNCATGPEFMTDHIRTLAELSRFPVAAVPNAGLPDENGHYSETPAMMGQVLERFARQGWVNLIGGCCGTNDQHIAHFAALAPKLPPRGGRGRRGSWISGVDFLEITDDARPFLVGERTNVIGSRKFKRLICEEKFEEAAAIARAQVKGSAHIVDVCLANPDRNEAADTERFLQQLIRQVRVPLMIDSTDAKVIELALTYCQGKALINSINLEDGRERFDKVVPLAKRFGAALVVGCIDDDKQQGMAVTRARKLAVAERSYALLTGEFGIAPEDIYWDTLVFPCATGDQNYVGSAAETIAGIKLIKDRFPGTRSILGISNVSFGLPEAGREVLNSVFLYHCVQAGLDLAIVNAEKLERYASIAEDERRLAEDLLFNRGTDPIGAFAARFRDRAPKAAVDRSTIPLDTRLATYIIEGSKDGLIADLELKRQEAKPLDIINGPLMAGMDEVGRLFNDNKLIVAEVLQSAEAMKTAVAHLEQFMEKSATALRGKVVLATVKGDVHDIGKNLVHIIFANNGFEVVNLGIKVPPEQLIAAVREHHPDIVGLSGLLVKSAQMMLATAEDFNRAGITVPVLVGGAALTERYVMTRIEPAYGASAIYARDAMQGLDLAKAIVVPAEFAKLKTRLAARKAELYSHAPAGPAAAPIAAVGRSSQLPVVAQPPTPPDFARHVLTTMPIDHIWQWINPRMLYGRHLGMKGGTVRLLEEAVKDHHDVRQALADDPGAQKIWQAVEQVQAEFRGSEIMRAAAVYQFFRCASEGNRLHVYATPDAAAPAVTFDFPRQQRADGLCLADLANPVGGPPDNLGMFVTTVGRGVRALADELTRKGEYLKSHILLALAIESAEGFAELLHAELRLQWGIMDPLNHPKQEIFKAHYQGKRYSFGYPACPRLEDQALLWQLLRPADIGCQLTEEFMMDPEASVSAVVFHHPQAHYFTVGPDAT